MNLNLIFYSSAQPQSSTHQNDRRGDVVIIVPDMDTEQLHTTALENYGDQVCIDTELGLEPCSPKTMTEDSSSK